MDKDPLLDVLDRMSDASFEAEMAWCDDEQGKLVMALDNVIRLATSALVLAKLWKPTSA